MTETPARHQTANDRTGPAGDVSPSGPASPQPSREPIIQTDQATNAPSTLSDTNGGLFRKRPDAIGPAPVSFEVLVGLLFGVSFGLILGHPIIVALIGAVLGLLYALFRRSQPPRQ